MRETRPRPPGRDGGAEPQAESLLLETQNESLIGVHGEGLGAGARAHLATVPATWLMGL